MRTSEELWRAVEHDANSRSGTGWLMRLRARGKGWRLLVAFDLSTKRRALCLQTGGTALPGRRAIPSCKGLDVELTTLPGSDTEASAITVGIKDSRFVDVFSVLADNLAVRVSGAASADIAVATLIAQLSRWQKLLAAATEGLGDEAQQGLWGELLFLRDTLIPTFGESVSINAWQGPRAAHQDFLLPAGAVEVKTTVGKAPHIVRITSERQLDDRGLPALYLRHFALAVREGAGETLPSLVASIRSILAPALGTADEFEDALLAAGYLDAHAWRYETRGYVVRETNDFSVRGRFPRLIEPNITAGIGDVQYRLSLDACSPFLLPIGALVDALTRKPRRSVGLVSRVPPSTP